MKHILFSVLLTLLAVGTLSAQGITPGGGGAVTLGDVELTVGAQPADDPHFVRCSNGTIAAACLVSGTVTAELSAVDNAVLDAIAASVAALVMYDEDFVYTDALKLTLGGCVYRDELTTFTIEGSLGPLQCNGAGALQISGSVLVSAITDPVTVTGTVNIGNGSRTITDDDSITGGEGSVAQVAAVEYRALSLTGSAARVVLVADPCQANVKEPFTINGTANAQGITGTASKKIHLCSLNIISETEQDINIVSGTGPVCATGTTAVAGVFGGTTAALGFPALAKGGIGLGDGGYFIGRVANNADNLCAFISGSGQYTVSGTYVVQ